MGKKALKSRAQTESLKNLKMFKKGQSGNPLGGKLHNPALRALRSFTNETFREVLELVLTGNQAKLSDIIIDPSSTNLEVLIAKAFQNAIKSGDFHLVERIAERLLGKVPDTIKIGKITNAKEIISDADKEEIKQILTKIKADVS
jgi:phage terminase small subunit